MWRRVMLAFLFAVPVSAVASGQPPAAAANGQPAASTHATAMAGQADATRIEACVLASNAFLDDLAKADYEAATSNFDKDMRTGLGADKLQTVWQAVTAHYGKLESRGAPQNILYQGYAVVTMPLHFAKGDLGARLACNASGKFAGFHLVPSPTQPTVSN